MASAVAAETVKPVAGLSVFQITAGSVAGASAPLVVSWNHSPSADLAADAQSPALPGGFAAPGSASRSSCPAAFGTSCLPCHFQSLLVAGAE